jgi:hypothetical protein
MTLSKQSFCSVLSWRNTAHAIITSAILNVKYYKRKEKDLKLDFYIQVPTLQHLTDNLPTTYWQPTNTLLTTYWQPTNTLLTTYIKMRQYMHVVWIQILLLICAEKEDLPFADIMKEKVRVKSLTSQVNFNSQVINSLFKCTCKKTVLQRW